MEIIICDQAIKKLDPSAALSWYMYVVTQNIVFDVYTELGKIRYIIGPPILSNYGQKDRWLIGRRKSEKHFVDHSNKQKRADSNRYLQYYRHEMV